MSTHAAKPGALAEQLALFFGGLDRTPTGRLTVAAKAKWEAWLRPHGLTDKKARLMMQGATDTNTTPLHAATAEKYASYLRRHGYTVTAPGASCASDQALIAERERCARVCEEVEKQAEVHLGESKTDIAGNCAYEIRRLTPGFANEDPRPPFA